MEPIQVAIALSLYAYNVAPLERARKLHQHFDGDCMDLYDLASVLSQPRGENAATELPYPTAKVYVQHALDRYGEEARQRCLAEEGSPSNAVFLAK